MRPVCVVSGLHRSYGPVRAVAGVDLQVDAGEVVALLGPNGAGKTTLTRCLVGLLAPDRGTVQVCGGDPTRAATRRRIGVVQQDVGFPRTLRVDEIVGGAAVRIGAPAGAAAAAVREAGMQDLTRRRATSLSGGQQRRLQLAMALVSAPELLVLDEPTEGLDVTARRDFWDMLAGRRDEGVGVLLTTHAVAEAAEVADRVVVMDHGRVVATGTPSELTAQAADRTIRADTSTAVDRIADWPGVLWARRPHRGSIEVAASDVEGVVRRLLSDDPDLTGLTVTSASLADAVAALQGSDHDRRDVA